MRFGVIQCSRCKTARGILLDSKTARCPRCGKTMDVKKTMVLVKAATEKDLAHEVRRANVAIADGKERYSKDIEITGEHHGPSHTNGEHRDIYDEIAGRLVSIGGRDKTIIAVARELTRCLGEFTGDEFESVLSRMGFKDDEMEKYLAKLVANDVVFEPRSGVFRCIETDM